MISAFLKKLLFVRQFSITNGKIEMLGNREIMVPSNFFFKMQDKNKDIYEISKKISFENMKELGAKMGASEQGMIKNMKDLYETFGFGPLEIIDLKNEKKEATIMIKDSAIAQEYLKNNKPIKTPQCQIIAGILAGMFSYLLSAKIECRETKCLCSGDSSCFFQVKRGL